MALSKRERETLDRLRQQWEATGTEDELHLRYYQGRQRLEQIGLTIPPSLRRFTVVANWPRVVADTIVGRQRVRSLILPGEETADPRLRTIWDANNLGAHVKMFNRDRCVYGRAFLSVGTNERNPEMPLVRVESPREVVAEVDVRLEVMLSAARFYGKNPTTGLGPTHATLYTPDGTVWCVAGDGGVWDEVDRDMHGRDAVPMVMHLNRRMSGSWVGESELSDIIPLADSAARSLTDMQFAQASHGAPRMYMTGVAQGDFLDAEGKPVPKLEAYFNAVTTITDPQGKVGQLEAADLKNFETAVTVYGKQASTVTGFPARYFGLTTTNPPAEGAIRADEAQLVERVEDQNDEVGMTLGWGMALALQFATGETVEGNRVRVDWHDPATPTVAQRMDAIVKAKQAGILSREGAWDELGWSDARKAKERVYFEDEANDPTLAALMRPLAVGGGDAADGDD